MMTIDIGFVFEVYFFDKQKKVGRISETVFGTSEFGYPESALRRPAFESGGKE